jgi:hypothetical protein
MFLAGPGASRRLTIATGAEGTGKGTNVIAIFHAALDLGVDRVLLLDADVRSIEPSWIVDLLGAVDGEMSAVAVPVYRRNRYEGNATNHIVSPLMAAVLGAQVQQPIAGDFAFNRAFVERAVRWPLPESAQLYGIDVHLTGNAVREGHRIVQVPLGRKIHSPGFPKILFMSQQVIDAAFHVITRAGPPRAAHPVPARRRSTVDTVAARPDSALAERTMAKVQGYLGEHRDAIFRLFPGVERAERRKDASLVLPAGAWAEVLADALVALAGGQAVEARDHLVALYLCRVVTYWEEIERLGDPAEIDAALDRQTVAVVSAVARRDLCFTAAPPMDFRPGPWAAGT